MYHNKRIHLYSLVELRRLSDTYIAYLTGHEKKTLKSKYQIKPHGLFDIIFLVTKVVLFYKQIWDAFYKRTYALRPN